MLVSINSTEITTDEIRISATNLETILLADDLFQNIDENAEEEVTFLFDASNLGHFGGLFLCADFCAPLAQ